MSYEINTSSVTNMKYREPYTLYKRKMGKGKAVYYYRVYDDAGNRKAFSTGQTTKAEAQKFITELIKKDKLKPVVTKEITFADYTADYFVWGKCDYIHERNHFGGKSISREHAFTERQYIVNHIQPYFKKKHLSKITTADVKAYVLYLKKQGKLSDGSINHIFKLVKMIFAKAVRDGRIDHSPADGIPYLRVEQKDRGIITIEEARRLFDESSIMDIWETRIEYIFNLFAIMTGCRRGEIIGLLNKYVHNEYVEIKHSWGKLSGLKPTKTKESRVIPIHSGLSKYLQEIKGGNPDGFIFSYNDGESPIPEYNILPILYRALEKIGISKEERERRNLTFHSFRHFFNTYCRSQNVTDDKVRAVTGHKTQAMVDNYTHFKVEDFQEVIAVQGSIFQHNP